MAHPEANLIDQHNPLAKYDLAAVALLLQAFYTADTCLLYVLLASPHLGENFAWIAALLPAGLHSPWWITLALAIVTLGFGEIVRIRIVNLGHPVNITDGAKGLGLIDSVRIFDVDLGRTWHIGG